MRRIAALILAFGLAAPAWAQDYASTGENRDEAIEALVQEMAWWKRGIARNRLRDVTRPCPTLAIDAGDPLEITCGTRPPAVDSPDGQWTTYTDEAGNEYGLLIERRGDQLVQKFRSDDGVRTNVYTFQDDGQTLRIDSAVTSGQLPRALRFHQTFRRTSGPEGAS